MVIKRVFSIDDTPTECRFYGDDRVLDKFRSLVKHFQDVGFEIELPRNEGSWTRASDGTRSSEVKVTYLSGNSYNVTDDHP